MGGFASSNQDYKAQSNSVFDTSIKTENYVSSNSLSSSDSSKKTTTDTETVDLDAESSSKKTSSDNNSKVWKSYEEAAAAGYESILTKQEFSRRKAAGGLNYDSYDSYLAAMYNKYNNDNKDYGFSDITDNSVDDIEDTLKNMSKEDFDQFVKEMKDNYDEDISEYEGSLDEINKILSELDDFHANEMYAIDYLDENAIGGRKDEILNVLYWFVQDKKYEGTGVTREQLENMSDAERIEYICKYSDEARKIKEDWEKAKREEADPYVKEKFSHLGINTLDEYVKYKNNLLDMKDKLTEAIKTTKNMRDSCYYDNLKYTKAYGDYDAYKPTDSDKADAKPPYNYSKYKESHPKVTPLEYMKMIKDKGVDLDNVVFTGIDNADELKTIANIADKYPDIAKTYNYLYDNDSDKLGDYFKKTKYELNNLEGQLRAEKFLSTLGVEDGNKDVLDAVANELGVTAEGLKDGLTQFGEGVYYSFEAFMTAIGAWEENRTMSPEEYKRMYILYGLLTKEEQEKMNLIKKDENGNYVNSDPNSIIDYSRKYSGPALSNVYELTQGIGNMLPSMAISAAITYACPAAGICTSVAAASAGATAGAVVSGISTGGNAYHNSMVSGASFKSSIIYGVYSGTSSAITQRVLGSIPFLSNVKVSSIATYIKAMGQQATQATVQGVLDSLAQSAILGKPLPQNEEELKTYVQGLFKSAAYGAITSGILNLPALGTGIYGKLKFNKTMHKLGFANDDIDQAITDYRKAHPEYANLTDNELKKSYGTEIIFSNKELTLKAAKKISGWIDITEPKALKWTYDKKTGKYSVDVDWPPYGGMEISSVKGFDTVGGDEVIKLDRFGSDRGGTYAGMPDEGVYSLDQRSIFNNPETTAYRQMELNKTKYISFCDGADDIVTFCSSAGIDSRNKTAAMTNSTVRQKVEALANKMGCDTSTVAESIFGEYGSYTADMVNRPDIYTVESESGVSAKYGYVGTAAAWVTPDGEQIASGGASQYNLRTSEATLNKLGIMTSTEDIKYSS